MSFARTDWRCANCRYRYGWDGGPMSARSCPRCREFPDYIDLLKARDVELEIELGRPLDPAGEIVGVGTVDPAEIRRDDG